MLPLQGPVMVLQDSTGGLIPLAKDSLGGVKEPVWLVSKENMIKIRAGVEHQKTFLNTSKPTAKPQLQ